MEKKINLKLRPSRYFFTALSGLHLVILFLACISNIKLWFFIIVFIVIFISYYFLVHKYVFRKNKQSIIALNQNQDIADPNQWQLAFYDKKSKVKIVEARLLPKGYVSDFFIILYFQVVRNNKLISILIRYKLLKKLRFKTISVLIFPDMIDGRDYHRLKLYLTGY